MTTSPPDLADLPTLSLFGLRLVSATPDRAVAALLSRPRARVAFVNAHCVNVAARDRAYAAALDSADLVLPDGAGVELAARLHGARLAGNLNGTDLGPRLARAAAGQGMSLFLLGAAPGVAERAAARLQALAPGLCIAGMRDGFAGLQDSAAAIAAINASGADMLWVATGVPAQDVWLARHADALAPRYLLGVGALFDFLAGRVARAPGWMRRARLEWLWRLALEPRRLFGRYVLGNATFLTRTLMHRLRHGRSRERHRTQG